MPSYMKAAIARSLREPLVIEQMPVPEPGPGDLLVRVAACGVCHSDVHAVDGDWDPPPNLPLIPGHEVAGHVAAIGEGVTTFAVGDRVGVPWMFWSCGTCDLCTAGLETICLKSEATGYTRPGGYAEYMVAPAAFCGHIPAGIDLVEVAPILCAGVTTYRGLKRTGARAGQWVAILGIGGLGHIAVQYAKALGMRVVAIDISEEKLALARALGAELAVNARTANPVEFVQRELGGVKGAIVTAVAPEAFEQAIGMLRPAGVAVYIGLPGGDKDAMRMSISGIVNGERTITGSNVGTRLDLNEAIDFAARGLVRAEIQKARLEEINQVLDRMRRGEINGRVVLDLTSSN